MAKLAFFRDGYLYPFFLKETEHYPEVRGKIRPPTKLQRDEFWAKYGKLLKEEKTIEAERVFVDWMAKRITEWDIQDDEGTLVAISGDALNRLPTTLFEKLWQVVVGREPADKDPNQNGEVVTLTEQVEADSKN